MCFPGTIILSCFSIVCVLFFHSEVAFGYKGLQIQLYYSAGNLNTLFKVKYTSRVTEKFDCVEVQLLIPHFMSCYVLLIDCFDMLSFCMHTVHWKYQFTYASSSEPCALLTHPGLNRKHVLESVYANLYLVFCHVLNIVVANSATHLY